MPTPRTLPTVAALLCSTELAASEAVRVSLDAAEAERASLNAYLSIHRDQALDAAEAADRLLARGSRPGPLHGVPVAVKDNIAEAGKPCPAGCAAYRDRIAPRDAVVVGRLRRAGAVVLGRTNMDELANGVTSDNPHHGPVGNPWRAGFSPGGSSGGSAAAVASGSALAALGTDTGGSVRIPASLCGVVGLKPSRGLLSTEGVLPLSTTLDHVGILARTVAGVRALLEVLSPAEVAPTLSRPSLVGVGIGVLEGFGLEPDVAVAGLFAEALSLIEAEGAVLAPVAMPALARGIALLARIYGREAALLHRDRLEARPKGFSDRLRRDLERGLASDPARFEQAIEESAVLEHELAEASRGLELLLSPTTPQPARAHGSPEPHTALSFTCPFNLTGHPAISLPMGMVDGLPVGLQVVARPGEDHRLLAVAEAVEGLLGGFSPPPLAALP